jgi:putative cell wall-binding protein
MDEQQQQRVNQAAEEFADAVKESYQTMADRGQSAQELNAQLSQQFFSRVNEQLRTHAQANQEMTQQLAEQQQRQQEAGRQLAQESVGAYMDFMNSMFFVSQAAPQAAERGAEEAESRPQRGTSPRGT